MPKAKTKTKAKSKPRTKSLPPRSTVKLADTWDLTSLFKTDADWETTFKKWEDQLPGYEKRAIDELSNFERRRLKEAFQGVQTVQDVLVQRYQAGRF